MFPPMSLMQTVCGSSLTAAVAQPAFTALMPVEKFTDWSPAQHWHLRFFVVLVFAWHIAGPSARAETQNPIIHADVPDIAMIRVGDTYYMSSTTMHMSPGVPIMKSKDLVNWELVNYAYN